MSQILFDNEHALMLADPPVCVPGPLEQLLAIPPSTRDAGGSHRGARVAALESLILARHGEVHRHRPQLSAVFPGVQPCSCGGSSGTHDVRHCHGQPRGHTAGCMCLQKLRSRLTRGQGEAEYVLPNGER